MKDQDSFSSMLEIAAENDIESFKSLINQDPSSIDDVGLWYVRKKKSNQMIYEERTPLMVAATYGSLEVLNYILSFQEVDVNKRVGLELTTALHCAASSGSKNVVEIIKDLVAAGADVDLKDVNDLKAADVIVVSPNMSRERNMLEELLGGGGGTRSIMHNNLRVVTCSSSSGSPPLSVSVDEDGDDSSPSSDSLFSPVAGEKKEYPIDPSIPDIKNSIYASDEFRMFSFKVRPCSRAYSHDWTECPFVHPGENARRRDPRKYHYSCVPCPDFRKGACRRGDLCEYAHGVFECWLHPAQYRTRLCKDGTGCARRVCFFAHTSEELRPLFVSTGSAVPSPRSMDMLHNPFTPPMSPSGLSSNAWAQQNVPTLHLPGSNGLQSSRLRASLSARDMQVDEFSLLNELCFSPSQARFASLVGNRSLNPSNLEDMFSAEILSSPRYGSDQGSMFSPAHFKSMNVETNHGQLLHASLGISSPIRMSPRSVEQNSSLSSRLSSFAQQEKLQQLRSLSSRELGSNIANIGSPMNSSWSNWGSPSGKLDWGVNGEELDMFNRSKSKNEEPDVAWIQSLVNPLDSREKIAVNNGYNNTGSGKDEEIIISNDQIDEHAGLGDWLENMQIDPIVTS